MLWEHLKEVYQANRSSTCPGLALVPKLKLEHINLTNFSKMRVDLAVQVITISQFQSLLNAAEQVLSNTVGKALQFVVGERAKETAAFVQNFDKFFDCLNVRSFKAGKETRNPFKDPYRSASDERLKVIHKTLTLQ